MIVIIGSMLLLFYAKRALLPLQSMVRIYFMMENGIIESPIHLKNLIKPSAPKNNNLNKENPILGLIIGVQTATYMQAGPCGIL